MGATHDVSKNFKFPHDGQKVVDLCFPGTHEITE